MSEAMLAGKRVVDLTQPISRRSPRSSDHPEVEIENVRWYSRHGLHTSVYKSSVHVGTHVDAPLLYYPDGASIDQIPLTALCGTGVVIDVAGDDWDVITPERLAAATPSIESGDIVVLHTGWHRHHGDEERYVLKAPGLNKDAVDWLVARGIRLIASDSPSPEHIFMRSRQWRELRPDVFAGAVFDPEQFPPAYGHKTFFSNGICLLEGLGGDIEQVVGQRCEIAAFPLKIVGCEAAQARAIALV